MSATGHLYDAKLPDDTAAPRWSGDGTGQPYWTVSSILRYAREEAGLGMRDVAAALRIRASQLQAIEDGRYHDLPGSIYAVGFVRSYAEYLGLDVEEVVERFRQEIADLDRRTELVFPAPVPEGRVPGGAILLVATVMALIAYGGWYYVSTSERSLADLVPALPDRLAGLLETDATEVRVPLEADSAAIAPTAARDGAEPHSAATTAATTTTTADATTATVTGPVATGDGGNPANATLPGGGYHGSAANAAEAPEAVPDEAEIAALIAAAPAADDGPTVAPLPEPVDATHPGTDDSDPVAALGGERTVSTALGEERTVSTALGEERTVSTALGGERTVSTALRGERTVGAAPAEPRPQTASAPHHLDATADTAIPPAQPVAADLDERPSDAAPAAPADGPVETVDTRVAAADTAAAAPAMPPPPPPAAPAEERRAYGLGDGSRIVIRAVADSWVQVNDRDGSLVMTRVLRPGDSYRVPDQDGLRLVTGNAGGLEIYVDGNQMPALGAPGAVLRNIPLDAERLRTSQPIPN